MCKEKMKDLKKKKSAKINNDTRVEILLRGFFSSVFLFFDRLKIKMASVIMFQREWNENK